MKTDTFYISKETLFKLLDEWLGNKSPTLKIEIHPVRIDEFLVYHHQHDLVQSLGRSE